MCRAPPVTPRARRCTPAGARASRSRQHGEATRKKSGPPTRPGLLPSAGRTSLSSPRRGYAGASASVTAAARRAWPASCGCRPSARCSGPRTSRPGRTDSRESPARTRSAPASSSAVRSSRRVAPRAFGVSSASGHRSGETSSNGVPGWPARTRVMNARTVSYSSGAENGTPDQQFVPNASVSTSAGSVAICSATHSSPRADPAYPRLTASSPSARPATAGHAWAGRVDHQPSVIESPCTTHRGCAGAGSSVPPTARTPRNRGDCPCGG